MAEDFIALKDYARLLDALEALAASGRSTLARLEGDGLKTVRSANHATALRGLDYIAKFVEGTGGTAGTEKYRELLAPLRESLRKVAEDDTAYKRSRRTRG